MGAILIKKHLLNSVRGSIGSFMGLSCWKTNRKKSLGIESIASSAPSKSATASMHFQVFENTLKYVL
jgi:hypothetical protein